MSGRLTAGEPLVPPPSLAPKPERPREKKPRRPAPPGSCGGGGGGGGKKRPHWVFRTVGGLVAAAFGIVVLAAGLLTGTYSRGEEAPAGPVGKAATA